MSKIITKGANLSLTAGSPDLKNILVEMGWNIGRVDGPMELDASVFIVKEDGKVRNDNDLIFYNNPLSSDGAVRHTGGTMNAQGVSVDLNRIPPEIAGMFFTVTIHKAEEQNRNFGMVQSSYICIIDQANRTEITRFDMEGDLSSETAVIFGELYRHKEDWKFRAIGQGYAGGLAAMAHHFGVDIAQDDKPEEIIEDVPSPEPLPKRKTMAELIGENVRTIRDRIRNFFPLIDAALQRSDNESGTRMILDRVLQDILGYHLTDIKPEQKIQGRKADYVLSVENKDRIVIETKRIGTPLRDKQIFQATSYGAYAGIRWALLTNMTTWQLYRISTGDKIEASNVFSIDLKEDMGDRDALYLYLISKEGMRREALLEKFWIKVKALSYESLANAILTDDILNKLRTLLTRDTGCQLTNEEVRSAIEKNLLQLE